MTERKLAGLDDILGERKMCAICHVPLNPKTSKDGTLLTHIHALRSDHEPRPVALVEDLTRLVCDFCLMPNPAWDMPAETTSAGGNVSLGDWCACTPCKDAIVAGTYEVVCERSYQAQLQMDMDDGTPVAEMVQRSPAYGQLIRTSIAESINAFAHARTGEPIPINPATWIAAKLQWSTQWQDDSLTSSKYEHPET